MDAHLITPAASTVYRAIPSTGDVRRALLKALSIVIVLGLTLQSIPLPIPAQVTPLSSMLSALALPVVLLSQRTISLTPLAKVVFAFVAFLGLHSLTALFIDVVVLRADMVRVIAWLRQVLALAAGMSVFWVLRSTLRTLSDRTVARLIVVGAVPPVLVGLLNILWGAGGVQAAGQLVVAIRQTISPLGYNHPLRASGLSLEPSHFVWYLGVLVIPVSVALAFSSPRRPWVHVPWIAAILAAFAWTFSATGFAIALTMLLPAYRLVPRRWWLGGFVGVAATVAGFVTLFPDNYLVASVTDFWRAIRSLDPSLFNASAMNLVFNALGPFLTVTSSLTMVGYGLGGTSIHLDAMVPPVARDMIMRVTWDGMPVLGNLVGKVFAEAGLIGLILLIAIWIAAYRELRVLRERRTDDGPNLLAVASIALVGVFAGYMIKHGSFAIPFLWFWLAYVDARYLSLRERSV